MTAGIVLQIRLVASSFSRDSIASLSGGKQPKPGSVLREKGQADGRGDMNEFACWDQLAGGEVDFEFDDGIRVLIFGQQIAARRVNGKAPGLFCLGWHAFEMRKRAVL